jgi:hypothetical protein
MGRYQVTGICEIPGMPDDFIYISVAACKTLSASQLEVFALLRYCAL